MIRVDRVEHAALPAVAEQLRANGVDLDESYGFVPIDSSLETFLTRGVIDSTNAERLESDLGIHIYPDIGVGPIRGLADQRNGRCG